MTEKEKMYEMKINQNWVISVKRRNKESGAVGGYIDGPNRSFSFIQYEKGGTIAYDFPYPIPHYIRERVRIAINRAEKFYTKKDKVK